MDICLTTKTSSLDEHLVQMHTDVESQMLCNAIVRATKDLHINQEKSRSEIRTYLKNDCQHLTTSQLVLKVKEAF